ncbi:GNAT family N-acetyltransferase [Qipengyuania psychrotolerans]|uniref:GNAT family N-acetyltransferase n=1 Tax=Qipengyuania psychrotolerans TaxID=2867238 RepID=A0ABX8ZC26_9SPHN|nr:GNAT family N-acetyltransferase [Qipengyuania psychrotolerans]QZD86556.1 GNAT family N-acetyltransferase [Qipengyuania psychrotolerans]
MRKRVLHARDLSPDLIALWQEFCRRDPIYSSPFYSPHFTQAVAQVRPDVRIAILEERGEIAGFLPFHLTKSGIGKPIGGQLNDYQGPILAPGAKITPEAILGAADISSYDFNHLPVAFTGLAREARSFSISPQMDLSEGYDAFVARKGSRWTKAKREIRRRYRKTEKDIGPIRFTFDDRCDATFQRHMEMKNALLDRAGSRLRVKSDWLGRTLDVLRNSDDSDFAAVTTTIHAGDRLLASHFGLRTRNVWHWWFPAYDLAAYKLGPGINLVDQCAMAAKDQGISLIDFGRGDGAFKLLFADRHVELCEGAISRTGSLANLVRRGAHTFVAAAEHLPLGRYRTYPRRAAAKFVTGVTLPKITESLSERSTQ